MSESRNTPARPPILRRLWVVVLLTCLLITMPVAMVILLSGPVYRWKAGTYQPISNTARYPFGSVLVLWLVAATAKAFLQPGGIKGEWDRSANPSPTPAQVAASTPAPNAPSSAPAAADGLPSCNDGQVIQTAREAIDESPAGVTMGLRVRDVGTPQETFYEADRKVRRCVAEVVLSNGPSLLTYQILYGPSGNLMVQSQVGDSAAMQYEVDRTKKEEAARSGSLSQRRAADASNTPSGSPASTEVLDSNGLANICHDAAGKDSEARDNLAQSIAGRSVRLGFVAKTYSAQSSTISAESRSRFGASDELTEAVIDTSSTTVPPAMKKDSRFIVEGRIEDGVFWGNVVEGCFVKLKATRISIDGF